MGLFNWLFGKKDAKCAGCGYSIHKNRNLCVKCQNLKKAEKIKPAVKKSTKKKVSKSKKHAINENNKHWVDLVDMRVQSMPMDFVERAGYTIDSLGNDHYDEYKTNEQYVPENKREEVASDRLRGLKSIRNHIQTEGNKAQKFHLDASIKGAKLYASSLGIYNAPPKEEKYIDLAASTLKQDFQKLDSWDDVEDWMLLTAEYRIKIILDLYGIYADYETEQDFRRITKLCRNVPIDQRKQIEEGYRNTLYVHTDEDRKRYNIKHEIQQEEDITKQNILIDKELKTDPNNLLLYNIYAYNLYSLGEIERGIKTILKAIKIDSQAAAYYDTAGEGYYMLKEYKKAVDIMSEGIKIAPDGLTPHGKTCRIEEHYYNRGKAYLELKKYEEAKQDFAMALTIDLGYKEAIHALKEIPEFID